MNTDDPHLKCHLMSQVILHICPHHHVVVLNLRCRRSCHNANENLRNNCWDNAFVIVWHMLGEWDCVLSACAMQPEFVSHLVSVFTPCPSGLPFTRFFAPTKQLSVTVWNVSEKVFMKSTFGG